MPKTNPFIKFISFPECREFTKRTLVGETETFQSLMNIIAFKDVEGCPTLEMRYLGGLKCFWNSKVKKKRI